MKLAVISDLHLGPGDCSDSFGHDDAQFLRFLNFLESNFQQIVLLGDIWETLTSRRLGNPVEGLARARAAHAEIAKRLMRPKYKYIHGNHDLVTAITEKTPMHWHLEADGKRLLFTHGHTYDVLIRKARWLSEFSVWFGAWLKRSGLSALYRAIDGLESRCVSHGQSPSRITFQRWAMETAGTRQADIVVTGHTHVAINEQHGSRLFLNSGTCSHGRYSYVALDTRTDDYAVCDEW